MLNDIKNLLIKKQKYYNFTYQIQTHNKFYKIIMNFNNNIFNVLLKMFSFVDKNIKECNKIIIFKYFYNRSYEIKNAIMFLNNGKRVFILECLDDKDMFMRLKSILINL